MLYIQVCHPSSHKLTQLRMSTSIFVRFENEHHERSFQHTYDSSQHQLDCVTSFTCCCSVIYVVFKRISLHPEGVGYFSKAAAWARYYPVLSRILVVDILVRVGHTKVAATLYRPTHSHHHMCSTTQMRVCHTVLMCTVRRATMAQMRLPINLAMRLWVIITVIVTMLSQEIQRFSCDMLRSVSLVQIALLCCCTANVYRLPFKTTVLLLIPGMVC